MVSAREFSLNVILLISRGAAAVVEILNSSSAQSRAEIFLRLYYTYKAPSLPHI